MTAVTPDDDPAKPAWMPSSPSTIEEDLGQLWQAAARQSPVSRALMSNLVIVAAGEPAIDDIEDMLAGVARRHPARVVLLNHRCTSQAREPQHVRVGLVTFGPSGQRYGIELISVFVACLDESLPSILRAITRGDVPTTLWLTGDLSAAGPAMPLVDVSRQMVYDSGSWNDLARGYECIAGLLKAAHPPALVDLSWRRLAPMRRAVAAALEPLRFDQRPRPGQVTIAAAPGRAAEAWLLWGWLRAKLGWPTTAQSTPATSGEGLELHFRSDDWTASVVQSAPTASNGHLTATIVARDAAGHTVTVSPSQETIAEALSAELTSLAHDVTLARIVRSWSDQPRQGT
jgi:glucose-6-phosphate dehydrogenase assembly protein OpcA